MRVLFSSTGDVGHVIPMLPLARALRRAGHTVRWATNADGCRVVSDAGLDAATVGLAGPALAAGMAPLTAYAATLAPQDRAPYMFPARFAALLAPAAVDDLLALTRAWRPDVLVHEQGELAAPLVAAALGVPLVTHSFGGATPEEHVAAAGERLAGLWAAHGLVVPEHAGCFTGPYLDICPPSVQTVPLDHVADRWPLRPVEARPGRVDPADPLVYLTVGTISPYDDTLRRAVVAVAGLPVRVLAATGPHTAPESLGAQPSHVRLETWVDQTAVLEQTSVVVSHAGSGTFLGALAHGLPQLCLPQAADQFRNAEAGRRVGAALTLLPGESSEDAIEQATARLLAEPSYARSAGTVAEEIRAMPAAETVASALARDFGS